MELIKIFFPIIIYNSKKKDKKKFNKHIIRTSTIFKLFNLNRGKNLLIKSIFYNTIFIKLLYKKIIIIYTGV